MAKLDRDSGMTPDQEHVRSGGLYRFVSYPLCIVFALFMFVVIFYVLIPTVNRYCVITFDESLEQLLIWYPTFIILDVVLAGIGIWLTARVISGFTGFCRRHIGKRK